MKKVTSHQNLRSSLQNSEYYTSRQNQNFALGMKSQRNLSYENALKGQTAVVNMAESKQRQFELKKAKLSKEERRLQQEIYMLELDLQ